MLCFLYRGMGWELELGGCETADKSRQDKVDKLYAEDKEQRRADQSSNEGIESTSQLYGVWGHLSND